MINYRDAGIYQAYINQSVQVDVVAAFIGKPSKLVFMRTATHLSRSADARAPVTAAPKDLKIVAKEHQLNKLE